jgi:putative membrane protein
MTASREPEHVDATRRTHLANERTYLAWWRTGLTALAVSVAFGKLVPVLADVERWPYVVAGVGFALVGTTFITYGAHRQRAVDRALDRGEFAGTDHRALVAFTACGVALGLVTLVLVVVSG